MAKVGKKRLALVGSSWIEQCLVLFFCNRALREFEFPHGSDLSGSLDDSRRVKTRSVCNTAQFRENPEASFFVDVFFFFTLSSAPAGICQY